MSCFSLLNMLVLLSEPRSSPVLVVKVIKVDHTSKGQIILIVSYKSEQLTKQYPNVILRDSYCTMARLN